MNLATSRIATDVEFDAPGRHTGDFRLRPSDNSNALGYHPIPVAVLNNGHGPTLLITGGTHGDEYEGPAAIHRLIHTLDLDRLQGRLILIPALNAPAVAAGTRCSPLDGGNLNRCFPGHADGSPTAQIAHLVESVLLPIVDAAIDIHSGGRGSEFVPLSMYMPCDGEPGERNRALADAFGAPYCWIMGAGNDNRTLNCAAERQGVPMFATELGGNGKVDAQLVDLAESGILRVMQYLGMWSGDNLAPPVPANCFTIPGPEFTLYAPRQGLFVPAKSPGTVFSQGEVLGQIYSTFEIERAPARLLVPRDGLMISQSTQGQVRRGDFIAQLARPVT